ncbi:MAG: glycosyltransferase family 2 protein [Spirosomataceae bacterium]
MPNPTPLSAVVITFNEAANIAACLDSLRQVTDDIVVMDSFSTDQTASICQQKGVRFYQRAWEGYSAQKNAGNALAQHDWILSLDADERLSAELAAAIRATFSQPLQADAFDLRFQTHFGGKAIRFGGWNPEWHIRLFNKQKIGWNTDAVHEGLTIQPSHRVQQLKGYVLHFTVDTPAQFVAKTERYSSLFAERAMHQGKKTNWVKLWLSPVFRFVSEYFFKLGFLDGQEGLLIAKENARYTYLKYKKLREQQG